MALGAAEAALAASLKTAFADAIGVDDGGTALTNAIAAAIKTFVEAGDVVGLSLGGETLPVT